ncbi:MAG: hypothetical protein J7J65_04450 [Candidatus Korarchaeota archaeon]|nr:hypothetical protein [Candidatus Korarchaeota archaeon]
MISLLLIALSRLHGLHEEKLLLSGHTPHPKQGYVSYEILKLEERGKSLPFVKENAMDLILRVLHGPEDPIGKVYRFNVILRYYYLRDEKPTYLKRDVYHVQLEGISKGALAFFSLRKGLARITPEDLISRLIKKTRTIKQNAKISYASFPDELDSCV